MGKENITEYTQMALMALEIMNGIERNIENLEGVQQEFIESVKADRIIVSKAAYRLIRRQILPFLENESAKYAPFLETSDDRKNMKEEPSQ